MQGFGDPAEGRRGIDLLALGFGPWGVMPMARAASAASPLARIEGGGGAAQDRHDAVDEEREHRRRRAEPQDGEGERDNDHRRNSARDTGDEGTGEGPQGPACGDG